MSLEVREFGNFEGGLVGCRQHDARSDAGNEGFLPTLCAQTPAVARSEAGKTEFWAGRRQVVAARFRECQELSGDLDANRVHADIFGPRLAASAPIKAGGGIERANLEGFAEDVALLI